MPPDRQRALPERPQVLPDVPRDKDASRERKKSSDGIESVVGNTSPERTEYKGCVNSDFVIISKQEKYSFGKKIMTKWHFISHSR